ncbi:hypothetical protein AB0J42_36150 [Nonomuraea sp. NPDC049649]
MPVITRHDGQPPVRVCAHERLKCLVERDTLTVGLHPRSLPDQFRDP